MFLDKIKAKQSGILLYGITPPKIETHEDKIAEIAAKTLERIYGLDIDALVVYDVQDESARTAEERPFPFMGALDPLVYARQYLHTLNKSKIIYRPAGKFNKTELAEWLDELYDNDYYPIFVGVPSPDFQPKTSLKDAYKIWQKNEHKSVIGAITIPERHAVLKDEEHRILDKMDAGVSYFISQCVYNVGHAKDVLKDLAVICEAQQRTMPTVIFTLTACGSVKTLQFMEWLGIHVPDSLKDDLLNAEDILARSVDMCIEIADDLIDYCTANNIPFGFNIESVAIRKSEIEASIAMLNNISEKLKQKGLRA